MRKLNLILFLFFLSISLFGCQTDDKKAHTANHNLSKEMPNDFNFSVQFGVEKKNEINTFDGTVTKDLIQDGTITIDLIFTKEEMKAIYEKMVEVNIGETKDFIPKSINGIVCMQEPHADDEWKIVINGKTITHSFSGEYCEPTKDAKQLIDLRNEVFAIIKGKSPYQSLPNTKGGYH